ncbi:MAG: tetratricopeptide repeat protein [Cytophagia bacterium]|nr:MAG: tetratricopeptide repeat protein [Runella sp.]TAG18717.1 MAG: tetratricopeptide repeat protein [Cytophagales bacterium]TAG38274.1 MAG: tetratricopeptide repeat protein [Cytophagia bacterium]TAG79661.1 MAG: tetratricopeptide repeat protein [Cytophagales bacterium]
MAEPIIIPLQRLSVFMPHRLSDVEMRLLFIARKPLFERLMQRINQEQPDSIPQHYLLVGVRGMGKTMLLRRLAVELSDAAYKDKFVGLSFPEEQYNIDRLSKFWLNALDALANALQKEGDEAAAKQLDKEIEQLEAIKIEDKKSEASYQLLVARCQALGRRPVFLLDNLNLIFDRLTEVEHSLIRSLITTNNAPIFVGASADLVKDDYQAPFYDAFDVEYLPKLDFKQTLSLIVYLADITGQADFKNILYQNLARLEALHQLTGGNVRTLILLFRLIVKDFTTSDIYQDLESLVDDMTPIYKAQFEEFPPQTQLVLDAIALLWDPCNLDAIREFTNLETGKISAHLDRLQKAGWIQKLGSRKKSTYEISERFFNVWYLMRRGSRRQGRDLQWLTQFLQGWFNKQEIRQILNNQIGNLDNLGENELAYYLPMSRALGREKGSKLIKTKLYKRLIEIFDGDEQKVKDCMGVKPEEINDKWFEEHRIEKAELKFVEACIAYANGRFQDAEKLYIEALPNSCRPHLVWYSLGRLLEKLGRYQEAKKAYLNSIELDESYTYSKLSLIYLYRDKLNDVASAKILFIKTKDFHENYLHEAIFALYEQNWGISAGYWERAFDKMKIEDKLENDLPLSAAVAIKLGYGQNLMALLEATDHHRKLRPFYEAIKALTLNSEDYLRTQVAAEVREVALAMYAYMKKYNDVP